jgi:5-methylcytosine-specific restriction endonuclease McrA
MAHKHPADAAFIQSRAWRDHIRRLHLQKHPLCHDCHKLGTITPAEEVHHIIVPNGDYRLMRDPANFMSLCKAHHGKRTRNEGTGKRLRIGTALDGYPVFADE